MRKFLLLVLIGCMILPRVVLSRAETKPSLAVLPFLVERIEDPARGAVCPVCKEAYRRGDVSPGSRNTLTRLLQAKVETMGIFNVLPPEKVEEVISQSEGRQFEINPMQASVRLGETVNADFILIGFLFRFEERIGSSLGVEKPASVAFDLHLLRLRDGVEVWKGKFDETQRPLSENLLKIGSFFRRKASWLTAEELASVGMDEILKRFPEANELEEK